MNQLNFIKDRWKKHLLKLWVIDIVFIATVAITIMYLFSVFIAITNSDSVKLKNYVSSKVRAINVKSKDYSRLKEEKNRLLDTTQDIEKLERFQYRIILGFEMLSKSIAKDVAITSIDFDETNHDFAGYVTLTGESKSLEQISVFVASLEENFPKYTVKLGKLGSANGKTRSFNVTLDFIENEGEGES